MDKVIQIAGHNIGISANNTGTEVIRYDGAEVSRKLSIMGATHVFTVSEAGSPVAFEVTLTMAWHGMSYTLVVKKNGIIVCSETIDNGTSGAMIWFLALVVPFVLAIIGNPSEEAHHLAIIKEYQQTHPIASAFVPDAIFKEECKYESHILYSTTMNGLSNCSIGYFWSISVSKM